MIFERGKGWQYTESDFPVPDMPSVTSVDEEAAREDKWAYFEQDVTEFANSEPDGYAAVLRAVARAMAAQKELIAK